MEATFKSSEYRIGIIRLSEMYFILAESLYKSGNVSEAVVILNELATSRRSGMYNATMDFDTYILRERKREFAGEGQLFYYYKLTQEKIIIGGVEDIVLEDRMVVLPFPEDEIIYGKRVSEIWN